MKVLVFDTETTGLPERISKRTGRAPSIYEGSLWPHIIQFSYILYDTEKQDLLVKHDHLIRIGNKINLSEKSVEIHGITRERANREGIPIKEAIELFSICVKNADMLIAHNLSFDKQMVLVESIRHKMDGPFKFKTAEQFFCTMKKTTELCKIETKNNKTGETYFKYPTLSELHFFLFDTHPKNTHNALVDILICLRCFVKLAEGVDILEKKNRQIKSLFKLIC